MNTVITPLEYAGLPLQQGFGRWAATVFSGDMFEAACVLQMGIFVARGRRFAMDALPGEILTGRMSQGAACHSFQPQTKLRNVRNVGAIRDFSTAPACCNFSRAVSA